jgi:phage-related protein
MAAQVGTAGTTAGRSFGGKVHGAAKAGGTKAGGAFRSSVMGPLRGLGSAIGGLFVASSIIGFFKSAVNEAREARKVTAATAAVIKSTGGAANVSAAQVEALADRESRLAGVDDEIIQGGANMLLTFKNIRNELGQGNDIFNQTTSAAVDMAAAMNHGEVTQEGLQSASIQLGKALNDPIKGLGALSRVGVQFDEGQKAQIKTMMKHGDILGAQKIILAEVKSQFEGAAEAGADPAKRAQVAWENFKEEMGTKLMPVVEKVLIKFTEFLPKIEAFVGVVGRFIGENKLAFQILGIGVAAFTAIAAATWLWNAALAANPVGLIVLGIAALVAALVIAYNKSAAFRTIVDAVWNGIKAAFNAAWPVIKAVFEGIGHFITNILVPAFNWLWHNVVVPAWNGIRVASQAAWTIMSAIFNAIGWVINNVIAPAFSLYWTVAQKAWSIITRAFDLGWKAINFVWGAIYSVIHGAIVPAFNFWWNLVQNAWNLVMRAFDVGWKAVNLVWSAFFTIITRVIVPLMGTFWTAVQSAWNFVQRAFDLGWKAINLVWSALHTIITRVIVPLMGTFWTAVQSAWNFVQRAFDLGWKAINLVWSALFNTIMGPIRNVFTFLWRNVVEPAWNLVKSIFTTSWNFIRDKVVTPLMHLIDTTLPRAFAVGRDAIGKTWDAIKKIVATPVKFVVETVYEKGIKWIWDKVAGAVGLPALASAKSIIGALTFAEGGIYPGYSPGRDIGFAHVSGGEAIMRPEWTRAVGSDFVHKANRIARTQGSAGVAKFMGGFEDGGVIGFGKSVFRGLAKGAKVVFGKVGEAVLGGLKTFAKPLVDKVVRPLINKIPDGNALGKIMRAIPNKMIDSFLAFLDKKDSEAAAITGGPGQWSSMWNWVKSRFPYANLSSGMRPGDPGYHGKGMAIDITAPDVTSGGPKAFAIFNAIKKSFKPTILELIYDFAKGGAVWNGKDHMFTGGGAGPGTHNDHIHWANKPTGPLGGSSGNLGSAQVAQMAFQTAKAMGANGKVLLALMEAGLVESGMQNLSYGDRDSVGFLQQRPSMGWSNPMHVPTATAAFVSRAMAKMPWPGSAGSLAQAVQVSAFPAKYDQREGDAKAILAKLGYKGPFAKGGIIPAGLFDNGGVIAPGTAAINMGSKPELVSRVDKLDAVIEKLETLIKTTGGLGKDFGRALTGASGSLVVAGRRR